MNEWRPVLAIGGTLLTSPHRPPTTPNLHCFGLKEAREQIISVTCHFYCIWNTLCGDTLLTIALSRVAHPSSLIGRVGCRPPGRNDEWRP